jgi:uncharacterized protein
MIEALRRRGRRVRAALLLAALLPAGSCEPENGPLQREYVIATGGPGGVYHPLGETMAEWLGAADTLRTWSAVATSGSVENIERVARREADVAFAIGTTVWEAYNGGAGFAQPQQRLRVIAPLYPNMTHVLVAAGQPARMVSDLRGMRVSVGSAGSGTEQVARQLLEAYEIGYDAIDAHFLSFSETTAALDAGAIDAAILSVGYPAAAVSDALAHGRAYLVPLEPALVRAMTDRFPYYTSATIPAGTYAGQAVDVPTLSTLNWIVGDEDLAPEVVERIVELLALQRDELAEIAPIAAQVNLANLYAAPIPLHAWTRSWLARPSTSETADGRARRDGP